MAPPFEACGLAVRALVRRKVQKISRWQVWDASQRPPEALPVAQWGIPAVPRHPSQTLLVTTRSIEQMSISEKFHRLDFADQLALMIRRCYLRRWLIGRIKGQSRYETYGVPWSLTPVPEFRVQRPRPGHEAP